MFKYAFIFALFVSMALAAPAVVSEMSTAKPVSTTPIVEILESGASHEVDGAYHFHFRADDGSFREETAVVKNPGTKQAYLEVTGAYSYFDVDGKEVIVNYKANHRGFVPEGGNIPDSIAEAAKSNSLLPPVVEKRSGIDAVDTVATRT